ncbi:hypothetical protein [Vibrio nereis]|uniref:Uncharacterized protein n=1 Tax=Vibrio nereis TaxID=693 RepID=A0A0M0HLP2_VIBNE|nr:hypothetical protein [Vibrio nereis]KOO02970.1 hypothetical protein AKJ17_12725 [Vibrio nereis]
MKKRWILSLTCVLGIVSWFHLQQASGTLNASATAAHPQNASNFETKATLDSVSNRQASQQTGKSPISALVLITEDAADSGNPTGAVQENVADSSSHEEQRQQEAEYWPETRTINGEANLSNTATSTNGKPYINQHVYQRLQQELSGWELVEDKPTNFRLWVADLFDDPEHDFVSIRIELKLQGVKMSGSSALTFRGIPKATASPQLKISAKDDHHGNDEEAWVSAHFDLSLTHAAELNRHPLEGETVYRLETTHNLNNQYTLYEVVYCEAFKFVQQEVFYAASNNKTQCPTEEQLRKVGSYTVNADTLIVSSNQSFLDAEQTWKLKKQYPSVKHPEVTNYFVSVHNGKQFESYTMQKDRAVFEERINATTGQYLYQIAWFDYLLPLPSGDYLITEVGNYIYDHGSESVGPYNETIDSDLNLRSYNKNLSCRNIATWYESQVIAGKGNYDIDLISSQLPYEPTYNIDCFEYVSNLVTGQRSLAFDLNYSPYDEPVAGQVYSYILRPKPQYAERLEELKLNLIYHHPRN